MTRPLTSSTFQSKEKILALLIQKKTLQNFILISTDPRFKDNTVRALIPVLVFLIKENSTKFVLHVIIIYSR